MPERCEYCGRFMKHVWFLTGEHDDDWQDYWKCSRDAEHAAADPEHWSHHLSNEPHDQESER